MATSQIRKTELVERSAGTGSGVGGKKTRIPLNKGGLIAEHHISIKVSQAFTGVPTSCDPRGFVEKIEVLTSDGKRVSCDGFMAYDLHRITEQIAVPKITLAATSTAEFSFELHHEMDGALHDLITALQGDRMAQLDLEITWAADAANGFIGGTVPQVATYDVHVTEHNYPGMVHLQGMGELKQFVEQQTASGATTGNQPDVRLAGSNSTRFVLVHAFDAATGLPNDAVVGNVNLVINGEEKRIVSWRKMRETAAKRGLDVVGVGLLDWGDDEAGFLDLTMTNDPRIKFAVAVGAPAGWRVNFGQVFVQH